MIVPLIELAYEGKSFIDPEIETRIVEVKDQDENSPMAILEPNEKIVAKMLGEGLSNEQIAARLGFKDKRTISRINGQIYAAWDLNESNSDEKVARTRAALIVRENRILQWEEDGNVYYRNGSGDWIRWESNLELLSRNFKLLRFFLFIFNSFLARVYYHSQFCKKKFARNFYDYAFNRSIYVIRNFFLDRRIWKFKDFELSRSIIFSTNFRIDSNSIRLAFYKRLVLGIFKSKTK